MSDPNLTFDELKNAYVDYFGQVVSDRIGGRGRIRDVKACQSLVREGKLKRLRNGEYTAINLDKLPKTP